MNINKQPILRIPDTVREDTLIYRSQVEKFLKGDTSLISFRAYRVPMGIYEQRTKGKLDRSYQAPARLVCAFSILHFGNCSAE